RSRRAEWRATRAGTLGGIAPPAGRNAASRPGGGAVWWSARPTTPGASFPANARRAGGRRGGRARSAAAGRSCEGATDEVARGDLELPERAREAVVDSRSEPGAGLRRGHPIGSLATAPSYSRSFLTRSLARRPTTASA